MKWLFAPSLDALGYAIRTTIAALVALGISLWMELDQPQWSAMTVWIVAMGSRGESISKSKWRLVGTFMGFCMAIILISAFNQMPWLFFPTLSLWVGSCCLLATLANNFRSYAAVLSGYTTVIIVVGAIPQPDNIFMTAMSRVSYVIIGIACESLFGSIFSCDTPRRAREKLCQEIQSVISKTTTSVAELIRAEGDLNKKYYEIFNAIGALHNQIEFIQVELGPHAREGEHGRAALAASTVLLSRSFSMSARLKNMQHITQASKNFLKELQIFLKDISQRLQSHEDVLKIQKDIQAFRYHCRHKLTSLATQEIDDTLTKDNCQNIGPLVDNRILYRAIDEILRDTSFLLLEYDALLKSIPRDHFTFQFRIKKNPKEALLNGTRAFIAVNCAGLVWECTAWPTGLAFITVSCVFCAVFAIQENPAVSSMSFLIGGIWAVIVSFFLDFLFLPAQATYEMLAAYLILPMIGGGLAARNPKTAIAAVCYNFLMPLLVHPMNHNRLNEITWFNSANAVLIGVVFTVLFFHMVMPFNVFKDRHDIRTKIIYNLQSLIERPLTMSRHWWVIQNIMFFMRIMRHSGTKASEKESTNFYLHGVLSSMTLGLKIGKLKRLLQHGLVPQHAQQLVETALTHVAETLKYRHRTSHTIVETIGMLRQLEAYAINLSTRIELTQIIACLVVIEYELVNNQRFLSANG